MITRRLLTYSIGAVLLLTSFGTAGAGSFGTELPFVLGTGARVSGMGGLGTSFGNDASVQYFNPSALSFVDWKNFVFFRSTLFDSQSIYHSLSYSHPLLNHGTLAVTFMRVDVGGIEQRDDTNQLLSTDLHDSQTRILLGYGMRIGSAFAAGLNVKFDNQSFGAYSGSGVGLDLGFSANQTLSGHSFIRGFRQGLVIQNIVEPSLKLNQEKVADPASIALGLSVFSGTGNLGLVTTLDLANPRYSPVTFHLGQEITYLDNYSIRAGLDDASPTFGFGAKYKGVALDYAYRGEDFGNSHRLSLTVQFGPSVMQRQATARVQRETELNNTISTRMTELERSQVDRALAKGQTLLQNKDHEAALEQFDIALLWDPDNQSIINLSTKCRYDQSLGLATAAMQQDDYVDAVFHLQKALIYVPDDSVASSMAETCNQRIAAAKNSNLMVGQLLKKAIDFYAERRFADALSGFDEVLNIAPTNAVAGEYRDKCRANIQNLVARLKLDATEMAQRGNYESAIQLLEQALTLKRGDKVILAELEVCRIQRDRARAVEETREPVATTEEAPLTKPTANEKLLEKKYTQGMRAFDDGRFDLAIQSLQQVWSQAPEFHNVTPLLTKAYLFVGMNYYSEQNYPDAIGVWEQALLIDPDNNKAKRYLAKATEEARKLRDDYSGN